MIDVLPIKAHGLFVPQRAPTRKRCHGDGLWMIERPIESNIGSGVWQRSFESMNLLRRDAAYLLEHFASKACSIVCKLHAITGRDTSTHQRGGLICVHIGQKQKLFLLHIFLPFEVPSTPNQGCLAYVVFASARSQRVDVNKWVHH